VPDERLVFVDTNVLFYSLDLDAGPKRDRAVEALDALWSARSGALSVQVLSEWAVNLRAKKRLAWRRIAAIVEPYLSWTVVSLDALDPLEAMRIAERHRIAYWDALIVRSAVKAGASVLLSEDLGHGRAIEGVRLQNPFLDPA
jgi:predicted nucleic acid-binding protein